MADDEAPVEKIAVNYDAIDDATGFKKAEIDIWRAFEENVLNKPEDDRPDVDGWVDEFAEEKGYDRKRVKYVTTLGIYAGTRDEFNQRSGSGKAIYPNGDVYEGDFFEGLKHGHGKYTYKHEGKSEVDTLVEKALKAKPSDESTSDFISRIAKHLKVGEMIVKVSLEVGLFPTYIGDYHLGVRTGQGEMKNKDGSYYRGGWLHNKRHGQGLLYFVNGDIYSGEWEKGQKHGVGSYRFATGGEYRGQWVHGNFVEGQWIMADGVYYEGRFDKKNRPADSEATMHFPRQAVMMAGVFRKGKWAPLNAVTVSDETPADEQWVE